MTQDTGEIPYAVIFKAHFWDEFVESQFRRLQARAGTDAVFVVADETHGPVTGISHDKVLRITEDISEAEGFYQFPKGNSFWYNTDYALYHFINKYPDYKYIVASEYDVAVNVDIAPIVRTMQAERLDFVGEQVRTPIEDWTWKDTVKPYYGGALQFTGRLCCIAIFSWEFAAIMQMARKDHLRRLKDGDIVFADGNITWPSNEAFIGAEIERLSISEKKLAAFVDMSNYDWWPPYHPDQVDQTKSDAIFHPVLKGLRLVKSLLREPHILPAESWLEPNSKLRSRLDYESPALVIPALLAQYVQSKNANAIISLWLELHDRGWLGQIFPLSEVLSKIVPPGEVTNLALHKSASQSSVSKWSRSQIPHEDAANAVNGRITGDYAFHTAEEAHPWWMVDLGDFAMVSEIVLFNRPLPHATRANYLSLWGSLNGRHWELLHRHESPVPFGGAEGNPLRVKLSNEIVARFVRVELSNTGCLHLDQVQVFGFPVNATGQSTENVAEEASLIPVYAINLPKDTEKMASIISQTKDLQGIKLFRLEAFLGRNLPDLVCQLATLNDWSQYNKGTLGCFISHTIAWQAIAELDVAFAMVIEDDVFIKNYETLLDLALPPDTDLVFCNERTCYDSNSAGVILRPVEPILSFLLSHNRGIGTDGYLLTPQGAKKLLAFVRRDHLFSHVDLRLMAYCLASDFVLPESEYVGSAKIIFDLRQTYPKEHRLNAYSLSPFITSHNAEGPESARTIEDEMGIKNLKIFEVQ